MRACNDILVHSTTPIRDTIRVIDQTSFQIALITDSNHQLLGTVTDGDIRRGILKGIELNQPVANIMNTHPIVSDDKHAPSFAYKLMIQHGIRRVPVLGDDFKLIGIEVLEDFLDAPSRDNIVIIMAGGLGNRLTPLTNNCPKPLLKVGPKPILETIIDSLIAHSFRKLYLSVNYKAEMIESYFGNGEKWGIDIQYLQENKRLGTAGALSLLSEYPNQPILVINGDLLTKVDYGHLFQFHSENQNVATMCVREYTYSIPYGVIETDGHSLTGIQEKPIQRMFVNAGMYVLNPSVLQMIPKDTYMDMTQLFEAFIDEQKPVGVFPVYEYWLDIGKMDDYLRANTEYNEVFP